MATPEQSPQQPISIEHTVISFSKTLTAETTPPGIPDAFWEKLKKERPDGLNWDRADEAIALLRTPPDPEPTESQKFWRQMFETENSPYADSGSVDLAPISRAIHELFTDPKAYWKNRKQHVHDIDYGIRGGREIDPVDIRLKRMGVLFVMGSLFAGYDYLTGKYVIDGLFDRIFHKNWDNEKSYKGAWSQGWRKIVEVLNDKYTSDMANYLGEQLTGVKKPIVHELPDKAADMITFGFSEIKDKVNGTVLESIMRLTYQIPIFGAITEQIFTRITEFQERSSFHKDTFKAIYSGLGVLIGASREARKLQKSQSTTL